MAHTTLADDIAGRFARAAECDTSSFRPTLYPNGRSAAHRNKDSHSRPWRQHRSRWTLLRENGARTSSQTVHRQQTPATEADGILETDSRHRRPDTASRHITYTDNRQKTGNTDSRHRRPDTLESNVHPGAIPVRAAEIGRYACLILNTK